MKKLISLIIISFLISSCNTSSMITGAVIGAIGGGIAVYNMSKNK